MSSREIAELTGKRHPDVKRDIQKMLDDLGEDASIYAHTYLDSQNRQQTEYRLDREHVECLLTGYNAMLRMRVIRRLKELESVQPSKVALPDFSNPAAAARAWAEQYELQQAANQQLAIAAPKAAFVDRYVEGTGLKGFRQVCKLLNAKQGDFRMFLVTSRVMYRLGGEWVPYAEHIDAGRFSVKTGQADNGHNFNEAKFTPKGVEWIAGKWAAHLNGESM